VVPFNDAARAERLCAAIKSRLARRVEETKVWRESGHRSAAHWVAELLEAASSTSVKGLREWSRVDLASDRRVHNPPLPRWRATL
jgi:hypothetical protein